MNSTLVVLPVVVLLAGFASALLLRRYARAQAAWSLLILLSGLALSGILLWRVLSGGTALVFASGGWPIPAGIAFVADPLSAFLVFMCFLVLTAGMLYALGSKDKAITYPVFYPIFLSLGTGLVGAILTGDLFSLFVFSELLVFSGTILTALSDDPLGVEAAYKYFYMSVLASAFLLLGVGALYVSYGTLNMADLAVRVATSPVEPLLPAAIALLLSTFLIKSAVFPFHFWQPDFHTVSPTAVSAMLSSIVVKLGVYGFLRMTTLLFVAQAQWIQGLLIILGIIGVIVGGLGAIGTHNGKRMLAYSTQAQIGLILIGVGWGTPLSIAAALVFTFNHSLIKAAMLMLVGFVVSRAPVKDAGFRTIEGLGKSMPLAGGLFFVGGMALAGIPPTNGFISKLLLFESGAAIHQAGLLVVLGAASVLSLIYVMRAFQRIWWMPIAEEQQIKAAGDGWLAPGLLIIAVVVLGIWPEPVLAVAQQISTWLSDPSNYLLAIQMG
jgi:multicomponent Na+:H+ antiporter subunit D